MKRKLLFTEKIRLQPIKILCMSCKYDGKSEKDMRWNVSFQEICGNNLPNMNHE